MIYFRLIMISLVVYVSMTTFAFCEDAQVWKVGERRWTIQEENKYSKWIETTITDDFFVRHDIRVDCADVPYALRWIYARIHHLPAAATIGKNRLIGHWSTDWKHIPTDENWEKDRRFRTALLYMIYSTSTRTLPFDTYPILIASDSVTAGAMFLIAGSHVGIVSHIVMDGSTTHPLQTFEANLPTRIQRLQHRNFPFSNSAHDHVSGFVKFRWPVKAGNRWSYMPVKEHPFYSDEQYSPAFTKGYINYIEAVEKRIDPKVYDSTDKAEKVINNLARRLNQRIPIVLDGYKKCHENECPEGSRFREIYSTPDRDEFIGVMIDHIEELIVKNHLTRDVFLDKMAKINLQISPGRFVTMQHIFQNFKWMSSDPEATVEARWGLDKCNIIASRMRSAQESIHFIQKKYGKTDRLFAEREIRMQQEVVNEMIREGQNNSCTFDFPVTPG